MQQQLSCSRHSASAAWLRSSDGHLRPSRYRSHSARWQADVASSFCSSTPVTVLSDTDGPNTSAACSHVASLGRRAQTALPMVALHQLLMSLHMHSHAAEEASPATLALFKEFLEHVQALGPWGGVLFVLTVMTAEMVPLFPTQPLTLASGLLFGPTKGALFVVVGVTLAAINAYTLAKGVGRRLAEKVIQQEMGEGGSEGAMSRQLASVTRAIDEGGFIKQVTAITLLRLTPVVPFSASNYLLGLTPVQLAPMVVGTVAGMSVWSLVYASLGGASRKLLEGGADLEVLMADLQEKAGRYSESVLVCGLALGLLAGGYYLLANNMQSSEDTAGQQSSDCTEQQHHHASMDATPEEVYQQK